MGNPIMHCAMSLRDGRVVEGSQNEASSRQMKRLLFSSSGRRYPPLPGLFIDTRFVSWILVFERMVSPAAQVCVGFGVQDEFQSRDCAGIRWMRV